MSITILVTFTENDNDVYHAFSSTHNMTYHAFVNHLFHHLNMYNDNPFRTNTMYGRFVEMRVIECNTPLSQRNNIAYFSTMQQHVFTPLFFNLIDVNHYINNNITNQTEPYPIMYSNMSTTHTITHHTI